MADPEKIRQAVRKGRVALSAFGPGDARSVASSPLGTRLSQPGSAQASSVAASSAVAPVDVASMRGLSSDFQDWLRDSAYSGQDFVRADVRGGSFGGRVTPGQTVNRRPVVFVHGAADSALGHGPVFVTGWRDSVKHFQEQGYTSAELYGTTWGRASQLLASFESHTAKNLLQVRKFIEAVLDYSGAEQVDVVAHSMGVTMALKAIYGGTGHASDGPYDLGPPLTDRVRSIVGIAGGNRGAAWARTPAAFFLPAMGWKDGLFPGFPTPFGVMGRSPVLDDIEAHGGPSSMRRYSIWSHLDPAAAPTLGYVYGKPTSRIPGQDDERVINHLGHTGLKDNTAAEQLAFLNRT
jgi:hypothetical protein